MSKTIFGRNPRESEAHHNLVKQTIEEYQRLGYEPVSSQWIKRKFSLSRYIPDAIIESDKEIILVEAVLTNDHEFAELYNEDMKAQFEKPVRMLKVYGLKINEDDGKTIHISDEAFIELTNEKTNKGDKKISETLDRRLGLKKKA